MNNTVRRKVEEKLQAKRLMRKTILYTEIKSIIIECLVYKYIIQCF